MSRKHHRLNSIESKGKRSRQMYADESEDSELSDIGELVDDSYSALHQFLCWEPDHASTGALVVANKHDYNDSRLIYSYGDTVFQRGRRGEARVAKHDESGLLVCAEGHDPKVVLPRQLESHLRVDHRGKSRYCRETRQIVRDEFMQGSVPNIPPNIYFALPFNPVINARYCFNCRTVVSGNHEYTKTECGDSLLVPVKAQKCFRGTWVVVGPLPGILDDYQSTSYEDEENSFILLTDNPSE
ncbi:hypothetical protein DIURU_005628 [Diutina rugosa]|uniref:Uncharacterized protein n=1 Tax=Diutina rugosa TaxID=5481 RepID=A0A642UC79_DIURU|nr:uncharacterized protein DIURU_005628 [Diutina rugosa]KAA8896616.1 hypothetical protein DIURU_005628 [Diutina rugosa]